MSYGMSCVLDWPKTDIERVRSGIETAIAECAATTPAYANTRIDVVGDTVHVFFPRALVERPGGELVRPGGCGPDGYHCTYDHDYSEPMPKYDIPGEATISISSKRNDNQQAWVTATTVLARFTERFGGKTREF